MRYCERCGKLTTPSKPVIQGPASIAVCTICSEPYNETKVAFIPPPPGPPPAPSTPIRKKVMSPLPYESIPPITVESSYLEGWSKNKISSNSVEYYLISIALVAAHTIYSKPINIKAPLITRCTLRLANCARINECGEPVLWRHRANANILAKRIESGLSILESNQSPETKRNTVADLFTFIVAEQVFCEGNNRAAYFLIVMLSFIYKVPIPKQSRLQNRPKISFRPRDIKKQYMNMGS